MPGRCKFKDAWLNKDIYKDWLVRDSQNIHVAICIACRKAIKLQTMGEAALTSHAGGAGHQAAVRKLIEGNIQRVNNGEQVNGESIDQVEDNKEQVAICLQLNSMDRMTGDGQTELCHNARTNSISHNSGYQEVTFPSTYINSSGSSMVTGNLLHPSSSHRRADRRPPRPRTAHLSRQEEHQRLQVLEQQEQMNVLEWEQRLKVLEWEQELLREKRKAARQKERAFRMKKNYYKAKLKMMGEEVPLSSSNSSSDEDESKNSGQLRKVIVCLDGTS
ncbi:uncharacterized protein LOC130108147 [Lampris incognitus]|uniref:uncharacterized protein LOC130108147 n=1 Tax=Lampris incognitus TaxID=2546036 RepID=UPI0024B48E51|nr:uncharacterized protein LOC130108147 [Lampris incognitus]